MKVERFKIKICCGKQGVVFKTDQPVTKQVLNSLVKLGFKESEHFTKAGILYVDNPDLIITGPIGSDKLQIKCRIPDCEEKINKLEKLLLNI
jgi:hypothetical protein